MAKHFVLDENVIILAQKGENALGERDATCLYLLQAIVANNHALVMARSFWGRYSSQTKMVERQGIPLVPRVMAIIRSLVLNPETRFVLDHELPEIEGLEQLTQAGVDVGDRDFVRAAASMRGSILVTTDAPLAQQIVAQGIDQQYGFSVLSPENALSVAAAET